MSTKELLTHFALWLNVEKDKKEEMIEVINGAERRLNPLFTMLERR
jgi:hypothetical protein